MAERETLLKILDLARWAPSGDNTQPWRFEIVGDDHVAVHGHDTRDWCVYDFNGHASHMAHGALIETLRIAATAYGLRAIWGVRPGSPDTAPVYDVRFEKIDGSVPDPLASFIETRTVQRRPMQTTPLSSGQREALRRAVGSEFELQFLESFSDRYRVARLLWRSAYIRLTCPEAYRVHASVIEWGARFSKDRIPDRAVGADPLTAKLMRWVMQSWERVEFFNTYLFGTVFPRIELDFIPALACAAHVLMRPRKHPSELKDHVEAGMAMQRLWLTATSLGLHLQPEMTPVIFRWYVKSGQAISALPRIDALAVPVANDFARITRSRDDDVFSFFARLGVATVPSSRSLRLELDDLIITENSVAGKSGGTATAANVDGL